MKEIIEEALVKFGLNRIILEKEKEEVIKIFSIPKDQNILLISENKDCTLVITDFAIYFHLNTNKDITNLAISIREITNFATSILTIVRNRNRFRKESK